jgi:hypothetical protein
MENDPPFSMGKSTMSMAIFNSYVENCQRVSPTIVSIRSPVNKFKSRSFVYTGAN